MNLDVSLQLVHGVYQAMVGWPEMVAFETSVPQEMVDWLRSNTIHVYVRHPHGKSSAVSKELANKIDLQHLP